MALGLGMAQAADFAGLQIDLAVMTCEGSTAPVVIDTTQMLCEGRWVLGTGTVLSTQALHIRGRLGVDLRAVKVTAPELRIDSAGDINVGADTNLDAAKVALAAADGQGGGVLTVAPGVLIAQQSSGLAVRTGQGDVVIAPDFKALPFDPSAGVVVVRADGGVVDAVAPGASAASAPTLAPAASEAGATPAATTSAAETTPASGGGAWGDGALLVLALGTLCLCARPQRR